MIVIAILNGIISAVAFYALKFITYSVFQLRKNRNRFLVAFWDLLIMTPFLAVKSYYKDITIINTILLIVIVLMNFTLLHIFAEGKIWNKILVIFLNEASFFLGEMALFMLFNEQIKQLDTWEFNNPVVFMLFTIDSLFGLIIYYTVINIWKKLTKKKLYYSRKGLVFLIFPLSQTLLMYSQNIYLYNGMAEVNFFMITGVFLSFIADIFLMITIFNQEQLEEMKHKVDEINHSRELDKKYYNDIVDKQKELSKIRHDMKEQFIIMRDMMERDDKEGLVNTVNYLSNYIGKTKEQVFCADPTINAVMSEYDTMCRMKNIDLKYSFEIYNSLTINPVTICSVLSNLLRNAIEATERLENNRNININAALKGGYFHIIVENTYDEKYKKSGHKGLGLEILKGIAERQNGIIKVDKKDDLFTVEMSIENINLEY